MDQEITEKILIYSKYREHGLDSKKMERDKIQKHDQLRPQAEIENKVLKNGTLKLTMSS
jgi:hypothetical protein